MSAIDIYAAESNGLNSPAVNGASVTTSDSTDLTNTTRAVHVTGTGGLVYATLSGMSIGTSIPLYIGQGGVFPCRATRIWTTGTTATGIVALY